MRHILASIVLANVAMATTALSAPGESPIVQIHDEKSVLIATLTLETELQQFDQHWSKKTETNQASDELSYPGFKYMLNIRTPGHTGLWRYNPNGLAVRLDKRVQPVFRIQNPDAFNALIGLAAKEATP
jgi:hypothetical protein